MRVWPALIGALALAAPAPPAMAENGPVVRICGGGTTTLPLPGGSAPMDDDHSCCKGACHAGCERRNGQNKRGPRSGG